MNSVMTERLVSGRRTRRSIRKALAIRISSVAAKASQKGASRSTRLTKVSAANRIIDPCAKLNTPDAR